MQKNQLLETYNFPSRALRNLGTFNSHYMTEDAKEIFFHYAGVNAIDNHTYPELEFIKSQCAEFLLTLLHAKDNDFHHFTTSGSSESILLAMLVLKKQHQQSNSPTNGKANIIIGENSHIAWYKAAKYLDIDLRVAALNPTSLIIDNNQVLTLINENTIGICCTLGAPITLLCDDIFDLNNQLEHHCQMTGQFIPIHVDAASGGFVIPFINPTIKFDFCLTHVFSINISSHKYGLVYPSLGWLFMRETHCLEDLLDESNYLGTFIKRFSIQFSHSAAHLMTQYYYIQTLGTAGYKQIITQLFSHAKQLKQALVHLQKNIQFLETEHASLPGLIFTIKDTNMAALSKRLKEKNWYLPVYSLPGTASNVHAARVVMRHGYNDILMNTLATDIEACLAVGAVEKALS